MNIRLPDRGEWVRIYMSTHPDPRITEERADRAYGLWIDALTRGQLIRERAAQRRLEEGHEREIRELNPTYRPGVLWPSR